MCLLYLYSCGRGGRNNITDIDYNDAVLTFEIMESHLGVFVISVQLWMRRKEQHYTTDIDYNDTVLTFEIMESHLGVFVISVQLWMKQHIC